MLFDIEPHLKAHNIIATGIIHVGAHHAEEEHIYLKILCMSKTVPSPMPIKSIIWVEANPVLVQKLITENPDRIVHLALLSDKDGEMCTFHITNWSQSSSMLELDYHKTAHPWVTEIGQIHLESHTGDKLLLQEVIERRVNFLNIDIQGAELLALRGMENILGHLNIIYIEVNEKHLYKDCALLPEVDEFLRDRGFTQAGIQMTEHSWGEALYLRQGLGVMSMKIGGWPRLGNQMFQYAYLKATAMKTAIPFFIDKDDRAYGYQLNGFPLLRESELADGKEVYSLPIIHLDETTAHSVRANSKVHYKLEGYYQNYRFFDLFKETLRYHFSLPESYDTLAQQALDLIIPEYAKNPVAFTCVHLRVPDTRGERGFIYPTPTREFIVNSLRAVKATADAKVVVLSNDVKWCEETYGTQIEEFTLRYTSNPQLVDLKILTIAESVVVSASTFGWWGAYLNPRAKNVAIIDPWFNPSGALAHQDTTGMYYPSWIRIINNPL